MKVFYSIGLKNILKTMGFKKILLLENAKKNGVTKEEIAAIITHATMYTGWPKGWAVFRLAKEVWSD